MTDTRAEPVTCPHCKSPNVQEARRTIDEITFRCLHCWKTFTSDAREALNQVEERWRRGVTG
jgi:transposase-like protein